MEYRTLSLRIMIFCQYHLLLGIGAAYRRTVAIASFENLPGTYALDPGYFMGVRPVGSTQYLPFVRPGGA